MSSPRRHFAVRSHWLGVAVTLLVLLIDLAGGLAALEQWSYDRRARHFQHFTPPPTDRLVLLDIDDAALETIGRWPWSRSTLADIIDELRLAGAEALALDVILSEPSEPPTGRRDGQVELSDEDANLTAALQRFGKVLVPMHFSFEPPTPTSPLASAALALLRDDLEMSQQEVASKLPPGLPPLTENVFVSVRRRAIAERIERELQQRSTPGTGGGPATMPSIQDVRGRLLPRGGATENTSSLVRQFNAQYARSLGQLEAQRFSREIPASAPPLLEGSSQTVPVSSFSHAAACSGYVSYLRIDGVVRVIPLFVKHNGRLYPQMDLALACHLYGTDIRDVQLSENEVVIPRRGASPIVIPIHTIHSPERGEVGAFLDIPWFGTGDWRTMYDHPAHVATKQHVPITQAWALADSRRRVVRNNAQAVTAISFFADAGLDTARTFLQKPPPPEDVAAWLAGAQRVLTEAAPLIEQAEKIPPAERGTDEKLVLQHTSALRRAVEEDRRFVAKAAELRTALSGKTVLLGWTGTGTNDEWPTSLHSACPGVVIHSVVFNAIMTGQFWRTAPRWVTALITAAIGLLTTAIVSRLPAWRALFATAAVLTTYLLVNAWLLFDYGNWLVGVAGPTVAALTVWGTLTLARFVIETRERARITRRFQTYVDPSVVRYVIEHPELARVDGQERELTVVFTDLAGFTTLAEQFRVKAVKILGRYISRMVPVIRGNRGLIHRFMGDGIMFSYGAPVDNPSHAADAIATILALQHAMRSFNEELAAEGYPKLVMRGGISTGLVMVGDSGAEDASEYACLGDTTNLASRLETANKMTGTSNLLSARTVELVDGRFLVRPIGRLQVVGKQQWVMTYEAMCEADSATEGQKQLAEMTRVMVDAYIAGNFAECLSAADALDAEFVPTKLTALYREACHKAIAAMPPDFQGQIVLQEK